MHNKEMGKGRHISLVVAVLTVATIILISAGLQYDNNRRNHTSSLQSVPAAGHTNRIQPDSYYDDPWVYFIGDDYTDGSSFGQPRQSTWIDLVGTARGWYPRNIGLNGAGYATSTSTGKSYIDQIEMAGLSDADGIVLSGGLNDVIGSTSIEVIASRISQALTRIRSAAPKTPLTVVSVFNPYSDVPPRMTEVNSILEAQANRVGAQYVYASDLLGGDPALVASDQFHASPDGHARIAQALAPQIATPLPTTRR